MNSLLVVAALRISNAVRSTFPSAARLAIRPAALAVAALLAAGPALADSPEYPPGLFENSPVRQPGEQPPPVEPSGAPPPDAMAPDAEQPDALAPDDCADIASRVFRSLAEVKAAHARCDRR